MKTYKAEKFSGAVMNATTLRDGPNAAEPGEYVRVGEPIDVELQRPCSLSEALNVIEAWGMRGNTLEGDDVDRLRALTDRIAPRQAVLEMEFGPHDILVIESEKMLSETVRNKLHDGVMKAVTSDTIRALILDGGLTVKVLHR